MLRGVAPRSMTSLAYARPNSTEQILIWLARDRILYAASFPYAAQDDYKDTYHINSKIYILNQKYNTITAIIIMFPSY